MSKSILVKNHTSILVVEDHSVMLSGMLNLLREHYPDADIFTAKTASEAFEIVQLKKLDLVITDISIPEKVGMGSEIDTGIKLLEILMRNYPLLNIMVQSSYVKVLVRLRSEINNHQGGFTVADKMLSEEEILMRVNYALEGVTHTKDLQRGIEIKPAWLELLHLAFEEGLKDKEIAKRMCIAERTVRHYWQKIQDVLEIYPEADKKKDTRNLRVMLQIRAREEGLID